MRERFTSWLATVLSAETRTGVITIAVAVLAIAWANSPFAPAYEAIVSSGLSLPGFTIDLHQLSSEFLLAIFFLVIGIELRHEFTVGSLNSPQRALVPVAAAIGGMVAPALIFSAFNAGLETSIGWGIPMATDIAFALAVLALVAPQSKPALRAFLLALAVVDDLGAIIVIAVFYTPEIDGAAFGFAIAAVIALWAVQRTRWGHPAVLVAFGLAAWWFVFQSGVHATIAGVAIGLLLSTAKRPSGSVADRALATLLPVSSYVAVPIFVFASSGVALTTIDATASPVFAGIIAGLVLGKPLGVVVAVWIAERVFGGRRDESLGRGDLWLVGTVSSIGFTVALLINDLAFGLSPYAALGTAAILVAAVIGAIASFFVARRVTA